MLRREIQQAYKVEGHRIVSPGKFEGAPIWAPYYWEAFLDGMADSDDGKVIRFRVTSEDRAEFPELKGRRWVSLYEDDYGFVHCN